MFEEILRVKSAKTIEINRLIKLVDGDPASFLRGASLRDVDLRGQDIRGISLEGADLEGVLANTRTQTDQDETMRSLMTASIVTYQNRLSHADDARSRGEMLLEIAAAAAYLGQSKLANTSLAAIDYTTCPRSISAILSRDVVAVGYAPLRVIELWIEMFGQGEDAGGVFQALSDLNFNLYWMGAAVDWIIKASDRKAATRLAKRIYRGPNAKAFLNEVEARVEKVDQHGKDATLWAVQHRDFYSSDLYFKTVKKLLNKHWHDDFSSDIRTKIYSDFLLSKFSIHADELINSYADKRKREDWVVAISQSIENAQSNAQFAGIDKAARRLDLPLPKMLNKNSSKSERRQYLDAALAQVRRIEPNFSTRVQVARGQLAAEASKDFPERAELYVSTMHVLRGLGGRGTNREIEEGVAKRLGISERTRAIPRGKDHRTKFQYELAWVRTYLKWGDAIQNAGRGVWQTTELGQEMSDDALRGLWKRVASTKKWSSRLPIQGVFTL